jgi:exopolysaccharide biosynthesis polyprenyl glycosylphosphotransferase
MITNTLDLDVGVLGGWTEAIGKRREVVKEVKGVNVEKGNDTKPYYIVKRLMDIVGSMIAFMVFSPFFLFVALFIKIFSRGPVFFKQTRTGLDGKHFEIYKFRTMKVDAEKYSGPVWAAQNDSRLIPGGNFLRKSKIDEIPQFINVLKGEMSIIGPRPERPFFVARLKDQIRDYEKRLKIKPGITGLAQVLHRADETINDVRKKVKYDILYIKRMCLWTDVRILAKTVRFVLTGAVAR